MLKNEVCTIIDVNEREKRVQIYNFTRDNIKRAFGVNEHPTFEEYQEFLDRVKEAAESFDMGVFMELEAVFDEKRLFSVYEYDMVLQMKYREQIRNTTIAEAVSFRDNMISWRPME